jgi:hypothetical protein
MPVQQSCRLDGPAHSFIVRTPEAVDGFRLRFHGCSPRSGPQEILGPAFDTWLAWPSARVREFFRDRIPLSLDAGVARRFIAACALPIEHIEARQKGRERPQQVRGQAEAVPPTGEGLEGSSPRAYGEIPHQNFVPISSPEKGTSGILFGPSLSASSASCFQTGRGQSRAL